MSRLSRTYNKGDCVKLSELGASRFGRQSRGRNAGKDMTRRLGTVLAMNRGPIISVSWDGQSDATRYYYHHTFLEPAEEAAHNAP